MSSTLNNLRRVQLSQGTRRNRNGQNETYNRSVQFTPGMDDLVDIVAGLQKDVKRINQALTKQGAKEWIRQNNKNNWSAHEEDITGPNGKPDGIKEVFVCDSKGNVKVINGYTLGKTSYPLRKLYRTMAATPEQRKEQSYTEFVKHLNKLSNERADNGGYKYDFDLASTPYFTQHPDKLPQFAHIRKDIVEVNPKEMFKQYPFNTAYEESKENMDEGGFTPMEKAQIFNKALSAAYNQLIRNPVILSNQELHIDPNTASKATLTKICKTPGFKAAAFQYLEQQMRENGENLKGAIIAIIGEVMGAVAENHPAVPANQNAPVVVEDDENDY